MLLLGLSWGWGRGGSAGPPLGSTWTPQLPLGQLPRAREGRPGLGLMSAKGTGAHGGLTGTEVPGRAAPLQAQLPPHQSVLAAAPLGLSVSVLLTSLQPLRAR